MLGLDFSRVIRNKDAHPGRRNRRLSPCFDSRSAQRLALSTDRLSSDVKADFVQALICEPTVGVTVLRPPFSEKRRDGMLIRHGGDRAHVILARQDDELRIRHRLAQPL